MHDNSLFHQLTDPRRSTYVEISSCTGSTQKMRIERYPLFPSSSGLGVNKPWEDLGASVLLFSVESRGRKAAPPHLWELNTLLRTWEELTGVCAASLTSTEDKRGRSQGARSVEELRAGSCLLIQHPGREGETPSPNASPQDRDPRLRAPGSRFPLSAHKNWR